MLINAFNNIKKIPLPEKEGIAGYDDLRRIAALQVGTGSRAFKGDQSGIWLGANKFVNAPFSVDMQGNLIASSAIITGYGKNFVSTLVWTATDRDTASWASGTIKTSDGTSYSIAAGNTGNIGATTYIYLDPATSITVLQTSTTATDAAGDGKILIAIVQVGGAGSECIIDVIGSAGTTIDGDRIVTGSIVADRLDVATLSAISANIGTITAGSITGVTITGSLFRTASSGARIEIDKDLFLGFPAIQFIHSGATYATIYMGAANTVYLNAVKFLFAGDVEASEIRPTGDIIFNNTKSVNFKDTGGGIGGVMWYDGNNDLQIKNYDDGSHLYLFTTGAGKVKINNVTKEAIVLTSDGYKALYCIESPEVWFMDFCESKDKIDPLFLEGTEGEMKFIKVEGGGYQVWRRRKGYGETRFEERTEKEYHKNNLFWARQR